MDFDHTKSEKRGLFEAKEEGRSAGEIIYSRAGENKIIIEHTEVDSEFQGKGVGKKLVGKVAEYARENNLKIVPECSYAKKVMERSSEFEDILA